MAEPLHRSVWAYRGLFALIVLVLLLLRLLPLGGQAGAWPGPDILLCLILAWVLRRPEYVPAVLLAVVLLLEDLLLMRPPGLWAAIVVLAAEFLRSRGALTRELVFPVEWALVAGLMLAALLANRLVLAIVMIPQPNFGFALLQIVGSILCYPLVVAVSRLAFGVRKPATGEVDAFGRRL